MLNELLQLSSEAYALCLEKGFYDEYKQGGKVAITKELIQQRLILIMSELGEYTNAVRANCIQPEVMPTAENYAKTGKGYASEELADVVLRCLDFVGCIIADGADIPDSAAYAGMQHPKKQVYKSANELLYSMYCAATAIMPKNLTIVLESWQLIRSFFMLISQSFVLADMQKIDLLAHVRAKYAYNQTRPPKHGKAF